MSRLLLKLPTLLALLVLTACVTLVAPYDATFDQSLNKFSEDTAKFTAAAKAGGPERRFDSKEAVAYYASSYNLLDRLIQRAGTKRGKACASNAAVQAIANSPTTRTELPADFLDADCIEVELYSVRLNLDQMNYAHETGGVLTREEAIATNTALEQTILNAIRTFLENKG